MLRVGPELSYFREMVIDVTEVPRHPKLTVLGTGYLGAVHAACLADMGFDVLGVDTDPSRIETLSQGRLPFFEPGLETLLRRGLDSARLRFSTSYPQAAAFGDVHFVCVGTPQRAGADAADLSQVSSCISALGSLLTSPCLVVGKLTVPVGTARVLTTELHRLAPAGEAVELAWNPEFLREGHALADTLRPDRIVVGVQSERGEKLLRLIYAQQIAPDRPFFVTDLATAELAKVAANSFLATKISFVNAMGEVCDAAGGDVLLLSEILGSDPRIGPSFLAPGLGFGGACLPKDIRAFQARARELGAGEALRFLGEVNAINLRCRSRVVNLALELTGGEVAGRAVGVLGAAFKPDSDDVRDSPALAVASTLSALGATVTVCDPVATGKARQSHPQLAYAASAMEAARDADVLLVLTEWPEFCEADPEILGKAVARRNIVDGRHALDPASWREAGWAYRAPGRPEVGRDVTFRDRWDARPSATASSWMPSANDRGA